MLQKTKDDWITVHPNGKEHKGRPLFVEEGETNEQAINRKYPKEKKLTLKEYYNKIDELEKKQKEIWREKGKSLEWQETINELNKVKSEARKLNEKQEKKQEIEKEQRENNIKINNENFYNSISKNSNIINSSNNKEVIQAENNGQYTIYRNGEEKYKTNDKTKANYAFKHYAGKNALLYEYGSKEYWDNVNTQMTYKEKSRWDSMDMQATDEKEIDYNDFWYIKDNPLSKVGVFPYLGKTISPELEPNKVYYVLRPEEELSKEETLDSFKLIPIVDDHTMLGTKEGMQPAEEKGVHGTIGTDTYYKDGVIYGDLKIFSETLKEEIENGKKELSMGYFCDYELADGEYNGQPYQAIQRNIKANHIALVQEGRMGADVRVLDHKITFDTIKEIKNMEEIQKEETKVENQDECKDEDVDKRALIDEVGGILKDKLDEELWRTVIGKIEEIAYNKSEAANNDEDIIEEKKDELKEEPVKDEEIVAPAVEEIKEDDEKKTDVNVSVSMDEMIKAIAERDALVDEVRPIIGDNANYKSMTAEAVAKYACDKLDLKVAKGLEMAAIKGYIAGNKKQKVMYSLDNALNAAPKTDAAFEAYKKGV